MCATAQVPIPFPLDFDIDDDPCLVCNGGLGADWICTTCKADHFEGVMLLIGYGSPRKAMIGSPNQANAAGLSAAG